MMNLFSIVIILNISKLITITALPLKKDDQSEEESSSPSKLSTQHGTPEYSQSDAGEPSTAAPKKKLWADWAEEIESDDEIPIPTWANTPQSSDTNEPSTATSEKKLWADWAEEGSSSDSDTPPVEALQPKTVEHITHSQRVQHVTKQMTNPWQRDRPLSTTSKTYSETMKSPGTPRLAPRLPVVNKPVQPFQSYYKPKNLAPNKSPSVFLSFEKPSSPKSYPAESSRPVEQMNRQETSQRRSWVDIVKNNTEPPSEISPSNSTQIFRPAHLDARKPSSTSENLKSEARKVSPTLPETLPHIPLEKDVGGIPVYAKNIPGQQATGLEKIQHELSTIASGMDQADRKSSNSKTLQQLTPHVERRSRPLEQVGVVQDGDKSSITHDRSPMTSERSSMTHYMPQMKSSHSDSERKTIEEPFSMTVEQFTSHVEARSRPLEQDVERSSMTSDRAEIKSSQPDPEVKPPEEPFSKTLEQTPTHTETRDRSAKEVGELHTVESSSKTPDTADKKTSHSDSEEKLTKEPLSETMEQEAPTYTETESSLVDRSPIKLSWADWTEMEAEMEDLNSNFEEKPVESQFSNTVQQAPPSVDTKNITSAMQASEQEKMKWDMGKFSITISKQPSGSNESPKQDDRKPVEKQTSAAHPVEIESDEHYPSGAETGSGPVEQLQVGELEEVPQNVDGSSAALERVSWADPVKMRGSSSHSVHPKEESVEMLFLNTVLEGRPHHTEIEDIMAIEQARELEKMEQDNQVEMRGSSSQSIHPKGEPVEKKTMMEERPYRAEIEDIMAIERVSELEKIEQDNQVEMRSSSSQSKQPKGELVEMSFLKKMMEEKPYYAETKDIMAIEQASELEKIEQDNGTSLFTISKEVLGVDRSLVESGRQLTEKPVVATQPDTEKKSVGQNIEQENISSEACSDGQLVEKPLLETNSHAEKKPVEEYNVQKSISLEADNISSTPSTRAAYVPPYKRAGKQVSPHTMKIPVEQTSGQEKKKRTGEKPLVADTVKGEIISTLEKVPQVQEKAQAEKISHTQISKTSFPQVSPTFGATPHVEETKSQHPTSTQPQGIVAHALRSISPPKEVTKRLQSPECEEISQLPDVSQSRRIPQPQKLLTHALQEISSSKGITPHPQSRKLEEISPVQDVSQSQKISLPQPLQTLPSEQISTQPPTGLQAEKVPQSQEISQPQEIQKDSKLKETPRAQELFSLQKILQTQNIRTPNFGQIPQFGTISEPQGSLPQAQEISPYSNILEPTETSQSPKNTQPPEIPEETQSPPARELGRTARRKIRRRKKREELHDLIRHLPLASNLLSSMEKGKGDDVDKKEETEQETSENLVQEASTSSNPSDPYALTIGKHRILIQSNDEEHGASSVLESQILVQLPNTTLFLKCPSKEVADELQNCVSEYQELMHSESTREPSHVVIIRNMPQDINERKLKFKLINMYKEVPKEIRILSSKTGEKKNNALLQVSDSLLNSMKNSPKFSIQKGQYTVDICTLIDRGDEFAEESTISTPDEKRVPKAKKGKQKIRLEEIIEIKPNPLRFLSDKILVKRWRAKAAEWDNLQQMLDSDMEVLSRAARLIILPKMSRVNVFAELQNIVSDPERFGVNQTTLFASNFALVDCNTENMALKLQEVVQKSEKLVGQLTKAFTFEVWLHDLPLSVSLDEINGNIFSKYHECPIDTKIFSYKHKQNVQLAWLNVDEKLLNKIRRSESSKLQFSRRKGGLTCELHVNQCSNCQLFGHRQEKCPLPTISRN